MTRAAVSRQVLAFDCPLVEITGGEPLLQADVFPLMTELRRRGPDGPARNQRRARCRPGGSARSHHHGPEVPRQRREPSQPLGEPRRAQADRPDQVRDRVAARLGLDRAASSANTTSTSGFSASSAASSARWSRSNWSAGCSIRASTASASSFRCTSSSGTRPSAACEQSARGECSRTDRSSWSGDEWPTWPT